MAIPLPLSEALTLPGAQAALQRGFAAALSVTSGVSAINLQGGFVVDSGGTVRQSPAWQQGLLLPGVAQALQAWFGVDAWQQTQQFTTQSYTNTPGFVAAPDVVTLYQQTQTPLPEPVQIGPPPAPIQPGITPPVEIQPPPPSPLAITPAISGQTGVPTTQPTAQYADWLRYQAALTVEELINHLKPVLPPIFEEQLHLTQAERDVFAAAASVVQPVISGLERVTDLLRPAQEAIDAGILTPLEQTRTALAELSARVREQVVDTLGAISTVLEEGRTVATGAIQAALETAQTALAEVAGQLEATISQQIAEAQEQIATAMAELVSTDQALVQWFQSLVPSPESFIDDVSRRLRDQFANLPLTSTQVIQSGVAGGINANLNGMLPDDLGKMFNAFLNACGGLKGLAVGGPAIGLLLALVTGGGAAALELLGGLFSMLLVEGLSSEVLHVLLAPAFELTRQEAYKACPVELISVTTAATLLRQQQITEAQYQEIAERHGYDSVQRALELSAQRALLTPRDLFTYEYRRAGADRFRGEQFVQEAEREAELLRADAAAATEELRKLGFNQEDANKLTYISHEIPPIQDLIRFATRDAFFPDIVRQFKADQEFPDQLQPFGEQQGLTKYWQMKYWQAHWDLPSLTQAYEMYHRVFDTSFVDPPEPVTLPSGKTVYRGISTTDLQRLMRAAGMEIYWRDILQAVAFRPLTRVDVRRAYNLDVIDTDEVFKNYLSQGYSVENAGVLTRFATKLKEGTKKTELVETQKSVAKTFLSAYERGVIDEHVASFALTDLGYDPEAANLSIAHASLERHLRFLHDVIGAIKIRFTRGRIDRAGAEEQLREVGIGQEEITRNLEVWCYQVGCDVEGTIQEKEKLVSQAEVLSFYDDGLIGQDAATERLTRLGYSQADAMLIVANAQVKRLRGNLKATIKAIHDNYLSGTIDLLLASGQLDAIAIPTETRDVFLQTWQNEYQELEIKRARQVYLEAGDHEAAARAILVLLPIAAGQVDALIALWASQKATIALATSSANGKTSIASTSSALGTVLQTRSVPPA